MNGLARRLQVTEKNRTKRISPLNYCFCSGATSPATLCGGVGTIDKGRPGVMAESLPYSSNRPSIVSERGVWYILGLDMGDRRSLPPLFAEPISTGAAISPGDCACMGTAAVLPGEVTRELACSVYGPAAGSGPK
jgi:hypothetical protein